MLAGKDACMGNNLAWRFSRRDAKRKRSFRQAGMPAPREFGAVRRPTARGLVPPDEEGDTGLCSSVEQPDDPRPVP